MIKKLSISFLCLILPSFLLRIIGPLLGFKIGKNSRVGFSFLLFDRLEINDNVKIGHFNLIRCTNIKLRNSSYIKNFNIIHGPINLILNEKAAIGKNNYLRRSFGNVVYGKSTLELGVLTKITANHFIDLTRSIKIGDYSIVAGVRSQFWTHGYLHDKTGPGRFRIDGEIIIGNNVYIGSNVVINAGVNVANAITIGSNSTVSKSLNKSGMYVSQGLRFIKNDYDEVKSKLLKIEYKDLIEDVYEKSPK